MRGVRPPACGSRLALTRSPRGRDSRRYSAIAAGSGTAPPSKTSSTTAKKSARRVHRLDALAEPPRAGEAAQVGCRELAHVEDGRALAAQRAPSPRSTRRGRARRSAGVGGGGGARPRAARGRRTRRSTGRRAPRGRSSRRRTPVSRTMSSASSARMTSPLPITGIETASFTARIASRDRSGPEYCCSRVRPWTASAAAPAASSARAASIDWRASSQPARIFTVTGTDTRRAIARDDRGGARRGPASSAEPAQRSTILRTGQPMLTSITSAPRVHEPRGGLAQDVGVAARDLHAAGPLLRRRAPRARACAGGRARAPSAITISVVVRPQPSRFTIRRKARFVNPAIGARKSGGSTTIGPMRTGPSVRPSGTTGAVAGAGASKRW